MHYHFPIRRKNATVSRFCCLLFTLFYDKHVELLLLLLVLRAGFCIAILIHILFIMQLAHAIV